MDLDHIRQRTQDHLAELRNLQNLISGADFEIVFLDASEEEQQICSNLINNRNLHGVKLWIQRQNVRAKEYEKLSVRQLRKLCSGKVDDYQYLSKEDLIIGLLEYDARRIEIKNQAKARRDAALRAGNTCEGVAVGTVSKKSREDADGGSDLPSRADSIPDGDGVRKSPLLEDDPAHK